MKITVVMILLFSVFILASCSPNRTNMMLNNSSIILTKELPEATSSMEGDTIVLQGIDGQQDSYFICLKGSSDLYYWVKIVDGNQ